MLDSRGQDGTVLYDLSDVKFLPASLYHTVSVATYIYTHTYRFSSLGSLGLDLTSVGFHWTEQQHISLLLYNPVNYFFE